MTTNCPHNVRLHHVLKLELESGIWDLLVKYTSNLTNNPHSSIKRYADDVIPSDDDVVSILDSIKSEFLNSAHEVN